MAVRVRIHYILLVIGLIAFSCQGPTDNPIESPGNIVASVLDYNSIKIEWVDSSDNESGFIIEREINNSGFETIGITAAGTSFFIDNLDLLSLQYDEIIYRVTAFNNNRNSEYEYSNSLSKHYKIAFMSSRLSFGEGWEIFLVNSDGTDAKRLTFNEAPFSMYPSWSPDGTKIANVFHDQHNSWIYLINSDGTNQMQLADVLEPNIKPEWSPDGTKIAYKSGGLYVINVDGTNKQLLASSSAGSLSWSPDGTKITFASQSNIIVINLDGTNQTILTSVSTGGHSPDWSSDGLHIVFYYSGDIYIVDADGTDEHKLTNDYSLNDFPRFSPDGTKIVFRSNRDGNEELYLMNIDGTGLHRLTDVQEYVSSQFDWSPDGGQIVFTEEDYPYGCSDCDIWIVTIDGLEQQNLTLDSHTIDTYPDWSPIPLP